jgi:hypothetical protein
MFARFRTASKASTITISVGLLVTLGVDIAAAAQGGITPTASAARHDDSAAVRTYLSGLRPVAMKVAAANAPAERVMTEIITPHAGDAFAARDALVYGETLTTLRSARAGLSQLHPPAALASQQRTLMSAVTSMTTAMRKVHALSSETNGVKLTAGLDEFADNSLASAIGDWKTALHSAYRIGHVAAPTAGDGARAATRTAWIFGADRACSAASFRIADVNRRYNTSTVSGAEQYNRKWEATLTWISKRITALPRPHAASALPHLLAARLRLLAFNASQFRRLNTALRAQRLPAVERELNQIAQLRPSLRQFAGELDRYGARTCGLVIGSWGGKRPSGPSGGGHRSTVTT